MVTPARRPWDGTLTDSLAMEGTLADVRGWLLVSVADLFGWHRPGQEAVVTAVTTEAGELIPCSFILDSSATVRKPRLCPRSITERTISGLRRPTFGCNRP